MESLLPETRSSMITLRSFEGKCRSMALLPPGRSSPTRAIHETALTRRPPSIAPARLATAAAVASSSASRRLPLFGMDTTAETLVNSDECHERSSESLSSMLCLRCSFAPCHPVGKLSPFGVPPTRAETPRR
eukprot:scaffold391_cov223-Pinguiococcus_pyrenoidosus.AAC.13